MSAGPSSTIAMSPWIGVNAKESGVLILGESWYGATADVTAYIQSWIMREQRDQFFSRIFNAASGFTAATATRAQRQAFWDSVMFDNFVNWSVGRTCDDRPTASDYAHAATTFPQRLTTLAPTAVWVVGREQAKYSQPILGRVRHVVSRHPCGYGVPRSKLASDWQALCAKVA